MICSVVLRPTDPLDNASTEVSNLTLPQNSPSYLFHPFRLPIRFLDSTIARSGIIFRPSPIIRHRFRPVRRGKITNSKYLILAPSNNFIGIETWPGKERIRARRVVFPIAKVGDRLAALDRRNTWQPSIESTPSSIAVFLVFPFSRCSSRTSFSPVLVIHALVPREKNLERAIELRYCGNP